jgi:hypothetical protein
LKTPDISILSDEFLEEVRRLPRKNLALELLRKLLNDEISAAARLGLLAAVATSASGAAQRHVIICNPCTLPAEQVSSTTVPARHNGGNFLLTSLDVDEGNPSN